MGWWLSRQGIALAGFHNRNYQVRLRDGTEALLRTPRRQRYPFDPKIWPESIFLDKLEGRVGGAPRVLKGPGWLPLRSFTPGESLADRRQGEGVAKEQVRAWLADFFAELARIPLKDLPQERPMGWPEDGDSRGFLMAQVQYAQEQVAPAVLRGYGSLLRGLAFPDDALQRFASRVPQKMTSRPFMLLHGDLHAGNIIVSEDATPRLIDWELAMVGDPLHDLAMHLERFGYRNKKERLAVTAIWRSSVRAVAPAAVKGLEADLRWYIDFQRVRSVYVDVVRTCQNLDSLGEEAACGRLAEIVWRALPCIGVNPSQLTAEKVRQALATWQGSRRRVLAIG